jgi:hypothetical protein
VERDVKRKLEPLELPRAEREAMERAETEAGAAWYRNWASHLSAFDIEEVRDRRVRELQAELESGTWGTAIRLAYEGDGSKLALALTRGRVPREFADDVYRLILAAPWAPRPSGRSAKLNTVDVIGVQTLYAFEHLGRGRPRDVVLDELARRYQCSRSTIERALARNSTMKRRAVTKRPVVRAKAR